MDCLGERGDLILCFTIRELGESECWRMGKPCLMYYKSNLLHLFHVLKLFPSVGTNVVKHYNAMGVHKSFPQGVVS